MEKVREKLDALKSEGWTSREIQELANMAGKEEDSDTDMYKVSMLLKRMGIAVHIRGYQYVREAIIICMKNPEQKISVTKDLYPVIAEKHSTTGSRVERAIRHSIEKLWEDNFNPEFIKEVFTYSPDERNAKPKNTEFLYTIVEYLRYN